MATLDFSAVHARPHYDRYVAQLTREIDLLTEKNRSLENRIANAESRISIERLQELDLDSRNKALVEELVAVENLCQVLRKEKDHILQVADNEIQQLRRDNTKYREDLQFTESQLMKVEKEKHEVSTTLSNSKKVSEKRSAEVRDLSDLMNRVQEEKRLLAERIERLHANERALVIEIERLKRRSGGNCLTPNQIESYVHHIEDDRNYWKREADLLQVMIHTQRQKKATSTSPTLSSSGYDSEKGDKPKVSRGRRERSRSGKGPSKAHERQSSPVKNTLLRQRSSSASRSEKTFGADEDLDYTAVKENGTSLKDSSALQKSITSMGRERGRSPSRTRQESYTTNPDLLNILRERDELRNLLNALEKRVIDIQGHVRILTQERDHLSALYDESRQELRRVREELVTTEESYGKSSVSVQNMLKRAEDEREVAISDLRRLTLECDKLREDLLATAEMASRDKRVFETRMNDVEHTLRLAQAEREEMCDKIGSLRQEVASFEMDLKRRSDEVQQKNDQLHIFQDSATKTRLRIEALQKQIEAQEREMEKGKFELEKKKSAESVLVEQNEKLRQELKHERDNSTHHRLQFARRDQEYHDLANAFEKSESEMMHLSADLRRLSQECQSLQDQLRDKTFQVQHFRDNLNEKEHALQSLKKQSDTRGDELLIITRKLEETSRENSQLKADLTQATRESRTLEQELRESLMVTEDLRVKIQEYLGEIKHIEDLLGEKEREQSQLLEKYRVLSSSAEERGVQVRQLQSDVVTLRGALEETERDLRETKDALKSAEQGNIQYRSSLTSSELQISDLQRALDELTSQHRRIQYEKDELLKDLRDLRDVCNNLERKKNDLEKEATTRGLDADQLAAQNDDLNQELDSLRDQLEQEQENKIALENALRNAQDKEQLSHLEYQEKSSEAILLKERVSVLTDDLECMRHDLERSKSRNQDLERDVERLNRSISNERFEKDRVLSELRIQTLSPVAKLNGTSRNYTQSPLARASSPSRFDESYLG